MKHNKKVFFENKDKQVHLRNLAKYDMDEAKRNANYRNVTPTLFTPSTHFYPLPKVLHKCCWCLEPNVQKPPTEDNAKKAKQTNWKAVEDGVSQRSGWWLQHRQGA